MKYQVQYDKAARGYNVVDLYTYDIVAMFGGGQDGEKQAKRCAANHNEAWLHEELAEYDRDPAAYKAKMNSL